jgi:putative ABC transport system ATP-binding protein
MSNVVVIEELRKTYRLGEETIAALQAVNLTVERGRFVAIMGASGSGKTTLLHLIGGLDLPDSGRVLLDGQNIMEMSDRRRTLFRRRNLGIVFQSFNLMPTLTARENVMLPLLVDGRAASEAVKRADDLIARVHLEHRARHRPAAMSGGEQQRVAIARALINDPILILADEPTGNLDPASSVEIWMLLRDLSSQMGTTVLMVTHEAGAAAYADQVHVLRAGKFVGVIETGGCGDAALVDARYAELAR